MGQSIKPRYKLFVGTELIPLCFYSISKAMEAYLSSDHEQSARLLERKKRSWNVIKSRDAYQTVNRP